MVSREHKREALHEKLQLLRSITNSHAVNKTTILGDASKYIEELKNKVERLNREIMSSTNSQTSTASYNQDESLTEVTVEAMEKGYLVNVFVERSSQGLLTTVLEAFEELNLNVLEASVSCVDTFRFEAVGAENEEESIDAQVVRQALMQAIKKWTENGDY
ncbi:hypothetical protein V2J09_012548 [Rumex salicifolius]